MPSALVPGDALQVIDRARADPQQAVIADHVAHLAHLLWPGTLDLFLCHWLLRLNEGDELGSAAGVSGIGRSGTPTPGDVRDHP
ncbi:hypothetical protein [Streptomyces atroolivaceus]|uniref:hypothetical protein n=1 Tax=Streptomyces atroolivaceus TaxID=66869 RepID=UPI00363A863F